ncbi:MAG: chalcone isomerase family protein [Acetobacteraceae bacterium]
MLAASNAGAAALAGVALPDTATVGGAVLRLNGIALRTYSWLHVNIYVAGLYLERPSHDAEAILASPERKLLLIHFIHDVDIENAREAWRDGFAGNCVLPCRIAPADEARFLAAVPAVRAGEQSVLAFTPGRLTVTIDGRPIGVITNPVFERAVLATFLGPKPPTERLKRGLLGEGG